MPPFWGVRVRKDFDLREVFQYINETALFKNQWQLKTASQEDYLRLVEEKYRPDLEEAGRRSDGQRTGSSPKSCTDILPRRAMATMWCVYRAERPRDDRAT